MSHRPTTINPTPKHSAHHPVVVSKHESCADGISKGADLLLPKHKLQESGFPWKFPEISGNFRRSAVGGRRSSPVGGRLIGSTRGAARPFRDPRIDEFIVAMFEIART